MKSSLKLPKIEFKDDLLYVMQSGALRLSTHDFKFLESLFWQASGLQGSAQVTSNQIKLFDHLTDKYKRQLIKLGVNDEKIKALNWKVAIVPSHKKYIEAYISIVDDKIYFRSPYNKKFIDKLRSYEHSGYKWDKENRYYMATYNTTALKIIVTASSDIFPTVNFCDTTSYLLKQLLAYDNTKYWEPTLVCRNGNYFIASTNESLNEGIKDISLEPTIENLCKLAHHGVKIDSEITNNDSLLEFASTYFVDFDYVNLDLLMEYLVKIKCNGVKFWGNGFLINQKKNIQEALSDAKIPLIHDVVENETNLVSIMSCSSTKNLLQQSYYNDKNNNFFKVISMKNSNPIIIK